MGRYKTGRLPAQRPAALADLEVYATGKLPTPPVTVAVPQAPYPIDGNDTYGDCVMAGTAHLIEAWNAEVHEHDFVPDEQQVIARYLTLTGGEDTGLVEANLLSEWHRAGNFHEKIAGYAPVNPQNTLGLHQAVAFYGGAMLGILCPESAQRQFAEQEDTGKLVPWTYEGEEAEDGHCIIALGYTRTGVLCATWGGIVEVTYGFFAHYLQEVWCVLSNQLVEAKKDALGLALATLQKDLALV